MPLISSVCERTAERPANSASSKASTVRPMGVTKPMPLTRTGADAARAAEACEAPLLMGIPPPLLMRSSLLGAARWALMLPTVVCAGHALRVDHLAQALQRDAGFARVEPVFGNAQVEGVFHGEDELHQRERVEAEVRQRGGRRDGRALERSRSPGSWRCC
jgi:hypothetical protein